MFPTKTTRDGGLVDIVTADMVDLMCAFGEGELTEAATLIAPRREAGCLYQGEGKGWKKLAAWQYQS